MSLDNGEDTPALAPVPLSPWRRVWQENRGMLMILISEMAGSSMDAIVRFLQQGGNNMHPFQVRSSISVLLEDQVF
jgi:hypothetical protein